MNIQPFTFMKLLNKRKHIKMDFMIFRLKYSFFFPSLHGSFNAPNYFPIELNH